MDDFTRRINYFCDDDSKLIEYYNKALKKYCDRCFTFWICYAIFKTFLIYRLSGEQILKKWDFILYPLQQCEDIYSPNLFHLTQFKDLTKEFENFIIEKRYKNKIKCVEMLEYALHSYYLLCHTSFLYKIESKLFFIFDKVLDNYKENKNL